MKYRTIAYETRDNVAWVSLDRPEAENAINRQMELELVDTFERVRADDRVKTLVLFSRSPSVFSVGEDLDELSQSFEQGEDADASLGGRRPSTVADAWELLATLPVPTVAALRGPVLGAGLELALACDIRMASPDAIFGFPEVHQGLIPGHGGTQRLPRVVGRGKALEMILTGLRIDATEAYRLELVSQVVPPEQLESATEELAERLAGQAPLAMRFAREAVGRGSEMAFDQGLHLEMDLYALLQTTHDRAEGIRAFREKRAPHFEGR